MVVMPPPFNASLVPGLRVGMQPNFSTPKANISIWNRNMNNMWQFGDERYRSPEGVLKVFEEFREAGYFK